MTKPLEVSPLDYHSRLKCHRDDIRREDSYLSKSVLWELREASLYRWRYFPKKFAGSDAADWGSVLDCLVTTPSEIPNILAVHDFPDFRTKEAREFRDAAKADGKICWNQGRLDDCQLAADRLMSHKEAARVIESSRRQVVALGTVSDVQFKGLLDLAPDTGGILYDIKTTGRLSAREMSSRIDGLGYHVQAALYLHLFNQAYGDDRKKFRLIWQENTPPYEIAITEIPAFDIEAGRDWITHQTRRLITATERNHWPMIFDGETVLLGRPDYASFRDDEELDGFPAAPTKSEPITA